MHIENIEKPGTVLLLVIPNPAQVPRNEWLIAMQPSVRAEKHPRSDVLGRIMIFEPSPCCRSGYPCLWIGAPHRTRVGNGLFEEFVICGRLGVHVAVRRVPKHRLV